MRIYFIFMAILLFGCSTTNNNPAHHVTITDNQSLTGHSEHKIKDVPLKPVVSEDSGMILSFFKFMARWDGWGIISFLITIIPSVFLIFYLFPRRRIKNLYIDTRRSTINATYLKVVEVSLTNHTNQPIYIISEGFKFGHTIRPSPHGAKDAVTGVYEVKFEGRVSRILSEIDTLVRPNQTIKTWVPVENSHLDQEIDEAVRNKKVGILSLKCLRLSDKRQAFVALELKI